MRAKRMNTRFWKTIEITRIAILMSLIFSFMASASSAGNIIENPGFENGITVPLNWMLMEQNGNIPVWDNVAHTGSKSIKIAVPGKDNFKSGYPVSDMIKVQPSGNYTATAWGKTDGIGGTNTPAVRVVELDANINPLIQNNLPIFSEGSNDWEQRTLDFQTGPETAYLYVYANIWDGYGTFWLDDVTIFSRDNLIENPGFENGITVPFNWALIEQNGNIPEWDNAAYTGSKSIKITVPGKVDLKSGYPASDIINVQPLSNYFISAWGKTDGAGGAHTPAVRVVELDSNKNILIQSNLPVFGEGTNDWEQKTLDLKTGQDTAYIYIYANIWDGYGTFWLDDVSVRYITSPDNLPSTPASNPASTPTPAPTHTPTPTPSPTSTPAPSPTHTPAPTPSPTRTPTPTPDTPKGIFYVAKNGNDNNPGTESKPWQTITKAAKTLAAGETVYVKEGTYNEQVIVPKSGSSGKYITFSANPGDSVTLEGRDLRMEEWSGLFWIKDVDYIKVIGFNLKNGKNGVHVNGGSNIIIKDNYIENPYHTGVKVGWEYSSNIIIDGNKVKKNIKSNWDEMISISNGHNVEVKNNHIMENALGEGIDMKDGTSDSIIHHNEVEKVSSAGVYIDGYADGVSDIEVYENTVHDSDIGFSTGSERGGLTQNIYFHDNTAYNTNTGYRKSYWTENGHEANYKNIVFSNNKAYNNQVDYSGI